MAGRCADLLQFLAVLWTVVITVCKIFIYLPFAFWNRQSESNDSVVFYEGTVHHKRKKPVLNEFTYPVRMALVSLDNPPAWFDAKEYLTPLQVINLTHLANSSPSNYTVSVLTNPKSCGYTINPISVYYVRSDNRVVACVTEVTNTPWGERVRFAHNPEGDVIPKCLHVSAFMDMEGHWNVQTSISTSTINFLVLIDHPQLGHFFTASLLLKKMIDSPLSNSFLSKEGWRRFFKYSLMPHRVITLIHWQAIKLMASGCPFHQPPPPYQNKVLEADKQIQSNRVGGSACLGRKFQWVSAPGWPWNLTQ